MTLEVEALVVSLRRECPGWGPETLLWKLADRGMDPVAALAAQTLHRTYV